MINNQLNLNDARKIGFLAWLFCLVLSGIGFIQAQMVNGEFCYALDDSFIMMAISKNLAFHNTWGLTQYEFSSTASSPLFTVLLAAFIWILGDFIWIPLAINLIALLGLFLWLSEKARNWEFNQWQLWILLMGISLFTPIPVLLFGSMEHILHIWIALFCLQQVLDNEKNIKPVILFIMGAALSGIRYEGLFEGGLIVLWFWKNKNWFSGFIFGLGLAFPVFWLGIYSISQGWFFLPNSLILKGYGMNIQKTVNIWGYFFSLIMKAAYYPHAIIPIFVLYILRGWKGSSFNRNKIWIDLIFWVSILHFVLARYNHVYRYEAYLMAISWVIIWKTLIQVIEIKNFNDLKELLFEKPTQTLLFIILLFSPIKRAVDSYVVGTRAIVNIFEQQVQTARFIGNYYNKASVGAIDVGAIAYYTDAKLLDIWGLGSMEMARLKIKDKYLPGPVNKVCRDKKMEIAIVYGNKLDHPSWKKVGSWVLANNVVCSKDTIDFIALSPQSRLELKKNLFSFQAKLPKSVNCIYYP